MPGPQRVSTSFDCVRVKLHSFAGRCLTKNMVMTDPRFNLLNDRFQHDVRRWRLARIIEAPQLGEQSAPKAQSIEKMGQEYQGNGGDTMRYRSVLREQGTLQEHADSIESQWS